MLKIASCQFPVSSCIESNAESIKRFMAEAADREADVILFPEGALSGYQQRRACASRDDFDWVSLRVETQGVLEWARKCGIAVLLGSCHYLNANERPTNCLYIVSRTGRIVDRYDKLMLFHRELNLHTAGSRLVTVKLNGIRCGFMICFDSCFPQLFESYRKMGVQVLFHALHNADNPGGTGRIDDLLAAQFRVRAVDYGMWIVVSNSSARHSRLPSCIVKPDGTLLGMRRHSPGIICHDCSDDILGWTYDNRVPRPRRNAALHIGATSRHPRALDPRALP
jgi:predicted amidohydrolase